MIYTMSIGSLYMSLAPWSDYNPICVGTQERCVVHLNGEYTVKPIEKYSLDLNADLTTRGLIDESQGRLNN